MTMIAASKAVCPASGQSQPKQPAPLFVPSVGCSDQAKAEIASKDFERANNTLVKVLASGERCPEAHFLRGYVLLRLDRPKESLAEYTAAAKVRTPTAEDLRNVALDYALLDDYTDADRWATRSLELDKTDPDLWYDLGRIRYSSGNFNGAYTCFQQCLKLSPDSVKAENNLGLALEALNRIDEAMAAYRKAIEMQRHSSTPSEQPLLNLAIQLIHRSATDEALPLLQQAEAIAPNNEKVHEHLGQLYTQENVLPAARKEYETAVSFDEKNPRLHFLLGQVYRRSHMEAEAQLEFATSRRLYATHSTVP
jgi:Flp pilus assembly protein TadD